MALNKIGGKARGMLVCNGVERASQYFHVFQGYLQERKSPYRAIVAFSGEHEFAGANVSEASLNGFPSGSIAERIQEDPYRFLRWISKARQNRSSAPTISSPRSCPTPTGIGNGYPSS